MTPEDWFVVLIYGTAGIVAVAACGVLLTLAYETAGGWRFEDEAPRPPPEAAADWWTRRAQDYGSVDPDTARRLRCGRTS